MTALFACVAVVYVLGMAARMALAARWFARSEPLSAAHAKVTVMIPVVSGDPALQTVLLGATFVVVATICDSIYALAAGRTGGWLNRRNIRLVERVSGTCLIGGGLWMLAARRSA